MPYKKPYVLSVYDSAGKFLSESDHESLFAADATAQRESADGNTALVKDRRHTVTKLLSVWVGGRSVFHTVNEHQAKPTRVARA